MATATAATAGAAGAAASHGRDLCTCVALQTTTFSASGFLLDLPLPAVVVKRGLLQHKSDLSQLLSRTTGKRREGGGRFLEKALCNTGWAMVAVNSGQEK